MHLKIGWKTITGAVVWAVGTLSDPAILAVLPHKVATVISTCGIVLGVIGARIAAAKIENKLETPPSH